MNADWPLVTIGIPTYNRAEATLPITLESALDQDYPNIEIVVSDNCSSDNTEQVISGYKDTRINYIRQNVNIGPTNNYKACLDNCRGDYFLLLHDDDLIDRDFISSCMAGVGHRTTFGLIRTGTRMMDAAGKTITEKPNTMSSNEPEDLYRSWLTGDTSFYLCSTLYNTKALRAAGGFKSKNNLFEDGIAIIKISHQWPILNIPELKASFRQHEEQRTHAAAAKRWSEDFKQAIDLIYSYNPKDRDNLYRIGMERYAKVSLHFARKIKNPIQRVIAMFCLCNHFPYTYWPGKSLKLFLIGYLGTKFYGKSV
ncbi:MAG: glycosyltransferase family 2 protein [Desulfobacteraceae bacterium]|nr:glycosyltransferase family 2 protein [Desulfobacteraceae bacterium]